MSETREIRKKRKRTNGKKEDKKKHKAKKAKKKSAKSSSESESSSDSSSDSEPETKKHHHAHRSHATSSKTLRVLKATFCHANSCGKATTADIFIAHPDSGASNHMTHRRELFDPTSFKTLTKPIPISLGDDSEIFATGKGTLHLMFNVNGKQKEGRFDDVLFVPDLKVTLLSVGQSARLPHCKVVFDDNVCEYVDKNMNEVIARAFASDSADLYSLDATPIMHKVVANLVSTPYRSIDINTLHRRLGHLGFDNCHLMVNHKMVDGVDKVVGKEEFCEGCAYGHSKRKHHPLTGTKTRRRLERVHIDLCGPLPNSLGGNRYFLIIIDEHTHYLWVEIISKKSESFSRLKRWKLEVEREANLKLQYLKSDGGKEFSSKEFKEWLTSEGVVHEISAPYEHEQNGLAERCIQNVSQRAMCQLFSANMSQGFWPYAVETAAYLINRSPTTTLDNKTPYKAWKGKRPSIKHLHAFGEMGYVHIPLETQKKWSKKSRPCRLLGYVPRSRNYRLWDPNQHTVVVSPNVDFDESSIRHDAISKQDLGDLSDAFGIGIKEGTHVEGYLKSSVGVEDQRNQVTDDGNASEWESDEEILRPRATVDEGAPNGSDPVVLPILQEPNERIRRRHHSEVE
jgi:hypothetical protein